MLSIIPHNLHWLSEPFAQDLCAHGGITVRLDERVLVDQTAKDWTLSAGALMLLRTLSRDHTADERVGEHLIPCCGFDMFAPTDSDDVQFIGCAYGVDWEVVHRGDVVYLRFEGGDEAVVSTREWRDAVVTFADAVAALYEVSAPKVPFDEMGAEGYERFWSEWWRRRGAAHLAT